jgi:hypothetical protein
MTPATIPITTPLLGVPHYGQRVLVLLAAQIPRDQATGDAGLV